MRRSDSPTKDLAAVCCYFNPMHYRSRLRNYRQFAAAFEGMETPLLTVELAFGNDPWELSGGERVMQIRTRDVMWQKECLLNRGIRRLLDEGFEKIAWIDADVWFHDPGWPARASRELERRRVVQLFETVHRVQPRGRSEAKRGSVAAFCRNQRLEIANATPGYAWAARAEVLAEVPLYDAMIVGGGDTAIFLASCSTMRGWRSALGRLDWMRVLNPAFRRHFVAWASKWGDVVQGQVGYLDQHASTFYHGTRMNRRYLGRRSLIVEFDPNRHVVRCPEGCWEWATDNEVMKQGVCDYFRGRKEDDGEVHCREQSCNLLSLSAETRTLTC